MEIRLDDDGCVKINPGDKLILNNGTVLIAKKDKTKLSCNDCYFIERECLKGINCRDCILIEEDDFKWE